MQKTVKIAVIAKIMVVVQQNVREIYNRKCNSERNNLLDDYKRYELDPKVACTLIKEKQRNITAISPFV